MKRNMRKLGLGGSFIALVVCLVLVTGSTFSLFTSETDSNISINAAKVEINALIDAESLELYSKGIEQTEKFENGGTVNFTEENTVLTLNNVAPGDEAKFNIVITNTSTIDIQYRIACTYSGKLAEVLVATANGAAIENGTSDWAEWTTTDPATKTLEMSVKLPIDAENEYQEANANVYFYIEAVQSNAVPESDVVATADQLYTALKMGDTAVLADDIVLDKTLTINGAAVIYLAGHTITNANGDAIVNNGTLAIYDGMPSTVFALRRTAEVEESVGSIVSGKGSAIVNNGKLTINGGIFEGTEAAAVVNTEEAVELVIESGSFVANDHNDFAIEYAAPETVTIKGGEFSGFENITREEFSELLEEGMGADIDENGNVTFAPATIMVGDDGYIDLLSAANAANGKEVTLIADITLDAAVILPANTVLNGNGKQINGTINAGGNLEFKGHTKVTAFSASFYDRVITIGEGACLEITGTGRVTLGYGNTFNITGSIENAKTADKETLQPSLIIPKGISVTGGRDATMNVTNAYVQIGSTSSKDKEANGEFAFNFTNSYVEFTDQFTFAVPANGNNPTFNVNIKDSVMTTGTKFIVAAPNSTVVIDNSDIALNTYFRNSGNMVVKNGSKFTGKTIQFGENGGNDGTLTVDASEFTIAANSVGHAVDGRGIGAINAVNGANVAIDYVTGCAITVDTSSAFVTKNVGTSTLTVNTDNWTGAKALVFPGMTAAPEATFTNTTLEPLFKVTDAGVCVAPTAKGGNSFLLTGEYGFWGEGNGNAYESFVLYVYEGEKVIATASLNNIGGIIDGDVFVTWQIPFAGSNDEYWDVEWAENYPNVYMNPTKVALEIDGTVVKETAHKWSGADDINKIVAVAEDADGNIKAYTKLADAMNNKVVRVIADNTIYVDGRKVVDAPIAVEPAPLAEDFLFPAGTNAALYKDLYMTGDAQIVHGGSAVLAVSNVVADLDHDAIVRESDAAIVIANCEFTLAEGAKLIVIAEGAQASHQVFLINVKVNGEVLTQETAAQYLDENIGWYQALAEEPNT